MRLAVLGLLVLTPLAAADPRPATPTDARQLVAGDCARARKAGKTCVLDLPAEDVPGDHPAGDGTTVRILEIGPERSLIRIRRDFLPEIVKAAEDL